MKSAIHAKRKIDAVIAIQQDNAARSLVVTNMNNAAERLTGYSVPEISGKNFSLILPPRINEILDGYLEYGNNGNDFVMVARRVPNFQILTKNKTVVPTSLKVFNLPEQGHVQAYELLLRDLSLINKLAELKELILSSSNTIKEKDPDTGLPSINSVVFAIDTSYSFLSQHSSIDACFALIEVTNLAYYSENYSEYVAYDLLGTLGSIIKKCLRAEDVIGYMGDGIIGVVLIDCNLDNAQTAVKRIKTRLDTAKITMQNGQAAALALAIAYTQIRKDRPMSPMIEKCESGLNSIIQQRGGEGIAQV